MAFLCLGSACRILLADADISLEDIGEDACALANGMLDAYLAKFESEEEPSPKRRKRG